MNVSVFVYAQNFYRYRKTGDTSAIDEMRKCIGSHEIGRERAYCDDL